MFSRLSRLLAPAAAVVGLVCAQSAMAQYQRPDAFDKDEKNREVFDYARSQSGVADKLGDQIPLDLKFVDSTGTVVTLGDYFNQGKPVIIQMAYYKCPKLCGEVMNGMVQSMRSLAEELEISEDYEVLTISFDPDETPELAASNKSTVVEIMGRSVEPEKVEAGWHFMTGEPFNIDQLCEALGFDYAWIDEAKQFSHPAVIIFATPDGRISRYLHGVKFDPQAVRLSTITASDGNLTPSLRDVFVYYCFTFDHTTGKYTATARTIMMIGGAVTMVTLGAVVAFLLVAERRGRARREDQPPEAGPPPGGAFA